jgi:photosystem II stability/assembly factor-like uncharacterized protein
MAEETLRRNLTGAFDAGPEFPNPLLLSRTMAAVRAVDNTGKSSRSFGIVLRRRAFGLIAVVVLVAVAAVSTGVFIAINQYVHRSVPETAPHARTSAVPGTMFSSPLGFWPYSADDAVAIIGGNAPSSQITVFITHDTGSSWWPFKLPCCSPEFFGFDVRWIDSNNVVVVEGTDLIEVTTDGGIHWKEIKSVWKEGAGGPPFFLNAHEGWRSGSSGLFHTMDGGAHWAALSSFPSVKDFDVLGGMDQLVFTNSEDGFFRPNGVGELWVTQDGGHTWSRPLISPPPPIFQFASGAVGHQGPFMFGTSGLLAFPNGDGKTLSLYATADGGLTWSGQRSLPGGTLAALDLKVWWLLDRQGHLSRTVDGGDSWQQLPGQFQDLASITPVGGNVLWGTTTGAASPMRSTDAGQHWAIVLLPG